MTDQLLIVFFGPLDWNEVQRTGFRKTSGGMLKALRDRADVERIWYVQHDRRWGLHTRIQIVDSKLTVVGLPVGLPYERFLPVRRVNRRLQAWLLQRVIRSYPNCTELMYWFYDWWNIEVIAHLPKAYTVMEVTDRASHFVDRGTSQQVRLCQIQKRALELVDMFFPVSVALADDCAGTRGTVTVLPNGIGRDFLKQARQLQPEPAELRDLPRPRLCVVSTEWPLNYRLDHTLLAKALEDLPEWQLVLIGCENIVSPALRALVQHPRVITIGLVPLGSLAAYIQQCDVCAVPYIRSSENSGDRLKIYEYLACGKPVILTVQEGQAGLKPFLRYAFDPQTFAQVCRELIQSPFSRQGELDTLLDGMTWDRRMEKSLAIVRGENNG